MIAIMLSWMAARGGITNAVCKHSLQFLECSGTMQAALAIYQICSGILQAALATGVSRACNRCQPCLQIQHTALHAG